MAKRFVLLSSLAEGVRFLLGSKSGQVLKQLPGMVEVQFQGESKPITVAPATEVSPMPQIGTATPAPTPAPEVPAEPTPEATPPVEATAPEAPAPETTEKTKKARKKASPKSPKTETPKTETKPEPKKETPMAATTSKKTNAKKTPAPKAVREKKDGLRAPQVRILKALSKSAKPMSRADLAKKAPVDVATCVEYIGSHDEAKRKANDKKHFPSLITLGLVRFSSEADGGVAYEITAAGKKALEKAE